MTTYDFLLFIAKIRGIEKNNINNSIDSVISDLSLQDVIYKRIEHLSKGFKRRVGIAQAIIHDPEILIMDEPTDGLDPNQKYDVRELIKKISKDKTIIVSTHILEEVEAVCTRAAIIAKGKLLFDDTPIALKNSGSGSLDDIFREITLGAGN
jgi:ABC-2 type transport system ATP-binding protein